MGAEVVEIEKLNDVFGAIEKPFGQGKVDLFLATKKGKLVKEAPPAYGISKNKNYRHYYFLHCFNCIYHCHYCYLQGYFRNPDIVVFVNRQAILSSILQIIEKSREKGEIPFFYSGEFSDSLALGELTEEIRDYLHFFQQHSYGRLELRTKSVKIAPLLTYAQQHNAPQNVIIAYSLAPQSSIERYEEKTPSLKARLNSIKKLIEAGYNIAIHLDPIIDDPNASLEKTYGEVFEKITNISGIIEKTQYLSLGALRFSSNSYRKIKKNHFFSSMFSTPMRRCNNNNMKQYDIALRQKIFGTVEKLAMHYGFPSSKIYRSMEEK